MKITKLLLALATAALFAVSPSAKAATLTANNLLGTIVPGTPSSEADEAEMVNFLVNAYNTSTTPRTLGDNPADSGPEVYTLTSGSAIPAPNLPTASLIAYNSVITGNQVVNLGTGYTYILAKYGNDSEVFYIGGMTGQITLANFTGNQNGLSHYVLFNPGTSVPDAGTTMALLGLACCGLGMARRRLQ